MLIHHFIDKRLFTHHFQPIYDLVNNRCIGFEVLLRSDDYLNPEFAFEAAKRVNRLYDLDTASIEIAMQTFREANINHRDTLLFINVLPSTLINQHFSTYLHHIIKINYLKPEQIVLEISESEEMNQLMKSFHIFRQLAQSGFQFALDDVGKGYSNFDVLVSIPFDFIKLDRFFSTQLHFSNKKQALVQLFYNYCKNQKAQLVLEGLETRQEYQLAVSLGVQFAQGFFLGRPKAIEDVRLR